ncbi:MAG: nitroreductase [Pseudomonadota bacterium]
MRARRSVRAFTGVAVAPELLRAVLEAALWAPSGGNLQPWRIDVVAGAARDQLVARTKAAIAANPFADEAEIEVYPKSLWEPYRSRRFAVGEALYQSIDIPREDKAARLAQLARNFEFFGAPVGLFFSLDRRFDKGQWAHLGMVMQSIALVAHEHGLATCMQEAWATRAATVAACLGLPETHQLYCGMALGYEDQTAPINQWRSTRAPLDEMVSFHEDALPST